MSELGRRQYIFENNADAAFLVVNNAVVDLALTPVGGNAPLEDGLGNIFFAFGDNVFIESIRFQLPYSFGNGGDSSPITGQLGYRDDNGNTGTVEEIGESGIFNIPSFNIDFPINTFIPQPANVDSKWSFEMLASGGIVSMLNVPASLNAATIHGKIFLNVRHTLNRVA